MLLPFGDQNDKVGTSTLSPAGETEVLQSSSVFEKVLSCAQYVIRFNNNIKLH